MNTPDLIYLDHAATTRTLPEAVRAMLPYFTEVYGNPSSAYGFSDRPREAAARARKQCADVIGADASEIFFTSGGTESDNWALTAAVLSGRGRRIITSAVEHPAVLRTCAFLEAHGARVTYLQPDREGFLSPEQVENALTPDTCLISVMTANNEIGTIEPIREIGALAKRHGILFHTDAVQAYCHIPIDVKRDHIGLMSVSGHKFGGPRGTGFLYIRKDVKIGALLHGGPQERNRRAGTENIPGIVGMGTAAELSASRLAENTGRERALRDRLVSRVLSEIPGASLNGPPVNGGQRLANNADFTFDGIRRDALLIRLDLQGICVSAGSACSTGALTPSHVLTAIGLTEEEARGSIRVSVGPENTMEEIDRTADALRENIQKMREMISSF